jgi:hypothetical protein
MNSSWKHYISIFFLTSFLLLRVVNLHIAEHIVSDIDTTHCEQCDLIAHNNQNTLFDWGTFQTDFSFHNPFEYIKKIAFTIYSAPNQKTLLSDYFHNKPPPNFLLG